MCLPDSERTIHVLQVVPELLEVTKLTPAPRRRSGCPGPCAAIGDRYGFHNGLAATSHVDASRVTVNVDPCDALQRARQRPSQLRPSTRTVTTTTSPDRMPSLDPYSSEAAPSSGDLRSHTKLGQPIGPDRGPGRTEQQRSTAHPFVQPLIEPRPLTMPRLCAPWPTTPEPESSQCRAPGHDLNPRASATRVASDQLSDGCLVDRTSAWTPIAKAAPELHLPAGSLPRIVSRFWTDGSGRCETEPRLELLDRCAIGSRETCHADVRRNRRSSQDARGSAEITWGEDDSFPAYDPHPCGLNGRRVGTCSACRCAGPGCGPEELHRADRS